MSTFSPLWPGPSLLVPLTLDALLVGTPNQSSGSLWAQTGIAYGSLSRLGAGVTPFQPKTAPAVGAHLLWTLPYGLRHGTQTTDVAENGEVTFHFVPNRWAILRSYVPEVNGQPAPVPPVLTVGILLSDLLHPLGPADSPYPNGNTISGIGQYVPLAQWDGTAGAAPFIQAVGPGDVSWSAAYDNIKNVFAFHDDLSGSASGFVTYQVVGWYSDPNADPLSKWQTADDWISAMNQYSWGVGQDQEHALPQTAIEAAQAAWAVWQKAHGLTQTTFNPAAIDPAQVPGQLAAFMSNWGTYYGANGTSSLSAAQLTLPAQTLCHGAVLGVHWQGPNWGYPSGAPSGGIDGPTVAVGNTPTESVGAWMANWIARTSGQTNIVEIETALDAFQKGLIFDLGRQPVETDAALHQARFAGDQGGSHWVVVRPQQDPSAATGNGTNSLLSGGGADPSVPLTPAQTQALIDLNQAQMDADAAQRTVQALLWELWALYYKQWYIGVTFDSQYQTQVTDAIAALIGPAAMNSKGPIAGLLGPAQQTASQRSGDVTTNEGILEDRLKADDATKNFEIKQINNDSFSNPVDPVVLVAGARVDTKHAPPGAYGSDGFLFTRFAGQTLTSLTLTPPSAPGNPITLGFADLQSGLTLPGGVSQLSGLGVPKELGDLWLETLLADSSCSAWLAQLFLTSYQNKYGAAAPLTAAEAAQIIVAQQTTLWNDVTQLGVTVNALAAAAQFTGVPPSLIALEDGSSQPWSPLYLDWEVEWHPSPVDSNGFPQNWKLTGLDYAWTGSSIPSDQVIYRGRATINPLISQTLAQQLESFVDSDPGFDALPTSIRTDLDAIKVQIQQFDFITQALSGLTDQLVTRFQAPSQGVPPVYFGTGINPAVTGYVQDAQSLQPVVEDADGNSPPYWPIRGGHFRITNLWVVDAYGQVLTPRAKNDSCVHFDAAAPVQTPGIAFADYVQLPPRFTQPSRLNFALIQADDDAQPTNSADSTSPICGWVMANHLDDSLMVFDGPGNSLGAVIAIGKDDGQTGVRWDAAPGLDQPLGSPPNLPNAHLQGFITKLLELGATGTDAFRALLDVVDASAWQTRPQNQTSQNNLAILAGRPLAVVRARVSIALFGDPIFVFDQDISTTGNAYPPNPAPAFALTPFFVRIGDESFSTNGVNGYFVADDYSTFYAAPSAPDATSSLRRALVKGQNINPALSQLASDPAVAPNPSSEYVVPDHLVSLAPKIKTGAATADASVYLTLLVDPSGRIPIVSGAFPVQYGDLPAGPVAFALEQLSLSFRVGPILLEPSQIKMPLPSEIHGNWKWMERQSVTLWEPGQTIKDETSAPQLTATPLRLREGWLVLSNAETPSS